MIEVHGGQNIRPEHAIMHSLLPTILLVLLSWASEGVIAAKKPDYDVCAIGAGGSGAFAAVTLKDLGHSVLVLEKEARVRMP